MVPHAIRTQIFGHIGIFHDECETFGRPWNGAYPKRRIDVFPLAGIYGGDASTRGESGAGKYHRHLGMKK